MKDKNEEKTIGYVINLNATPKKSFDFFELKKPIESPII